MSSDLTFITNEQGKHLADRFGVLLGDDTRIFDCLVRYFFIGGLEREIDELVYALYGLTLEEIKIVEESGK